MRLRLEANCPPERAVGVAICCLVFGDKEPIRPDLGSWEHNKEHATPMGLYQWDRLDGRRLRLGPIPRWHILLFTPENAFLIAGEHGRPVSRVDDIAIPWLKAEILPSQRFGGIRTA